MKSTDTTPRIVVPPASPDTERLAPPVPLGDGTLVIPHQANQPIAPADGSGAIDDLYAQYTVLGKIGDGGMGVVYLARDRKLGRHVAIKRLKPNAQNNPSLRRRFLHEARAAAALGHPHIAHVYSLGEDAEGPYIVMEYVAGELPADPNVPGSPPPHQTLEQYIARHGTLAVSVAAELLTKLSRAVAYAHSCGVIHRDLKPSNILMDKTGEPKVVDFGLARLMRLEDSKLTVPGEKLLSLGYGAPEQETDASVSDERADVYGLGALMYFVLTAQNPRYFREEDLPVSVRPILCKAIARDRELRWPTVAAFCEALQSLLSRTHIETPTVKTTWRCKWCDTINPLATRFCAECGWDGGERCLECDADTHVGVPFCRACGANARDYEQVAVTMAKAQHCLDERQLEAAVAHASRAIGLEPAGPNGRRLLEQLRALRLTAEKKLARREQLREIIELELRAENYERAARFIQEIRDLSPDQTLFEAQLAQIPALTVRRDLARVRRAFREQDWEHGARLLAGVEATGGASHADFAKLTRQFRRHRQARSFRQVVRVAVLVAALYVAAFPGALRWMAPTPPVWFHRVFAPASFLYAQPPTNRIFARYAALWKVSPESLRGAPPRVLVAAPAVTNAPTATDLTQLALLSQIEKAYRDQITEIAAEYRRSMEAWPPDYRRALKAQRDRYQSTGDFNGWQDVHAELARFESEGGILPATESDAEDLRKLKTEYATLLESYQLNRYRRLVTTTKRHLNELGTLLRDLTKAGQMDAADRVNQEILRLRADPEFLDAERKLADYDAKRPEGDLPALVTVSPEGLGDLAEIRAAYDQERRKVGEEYAARLEAWPAKYVEAIERFMEARQLEGDYLGWESASFELDRFEVDRTLGTADRVFGDTPLDAVKQQFAALRDEYALTQARGLVQAADTYVRKLDALISQYTKSKNIEAAASVNAEVRRVRASPELVEAQRRLGQVQPPPATETPHAVQP